MRHSATVPRILFVNPNFEDYLSDAENQLSDAYRAAAGSPSDE